MPLNYTPNEIFSTVTLGSGNHFLELGYVREVFEPKAARAFGLEDPETLATEPPAEDREILATFREQIIQTATKVTTAKKPQLTKVQILLLITLQQKLHLITLLNHHLLKAIFLFLNNSLSNPSPSSIRPNTIFILRNLCNLLLINL